MPSDNPQRKALKFFREHLQTQEPFTKKDLEDATGWKKKGTFRTYWSKQFKPFVVPIGDNKYRVSEGFRPFLTWKKFQRHVTQNRPIAGDYKKIEYATVIIYEFFMPLTNETALRTTLDALFYKDNVVPKLRAVGAAELAQHFPRNAGEGDDDYFNRVTAWIGDHFGGYSIYHVNGRFKASNIRTRDEAAGRETLGFRYLIDETTAVTRFIFPCKDVAEADQVRYFFDALFVRSIIQLINAEDEIWMVESGMANRVHIWRVEDDGDEGEIKADEDEDDEGEEPDLLNEEE